MAGRTKKFDACVIRIASGECFVAQWHQLVTSKEKNKLEVGSNVGYKSSNNKRDKIVRGKILVIGSVRLCEQQMKLFNGKKKRKKVEESEREDDDEGEQEEEGEEEVEEEEVEEDANRKKKSLSALNVEPSSESDDENLKIVEQEEENDADEPESTPLQQVRVNQEKNKNQATKSKETPSGNNDVGKEMASNREACKRGLPDPETAPPPKRPMVSLARLQELQAENARLKKQNEKFSTEWMPRPTDPAVIRFFTRMGQLFSGDENGNERRDKLAHACTVLQVSEEQLKQWHRPNGTKTARTIVRTFHPPDTRAGFTGDDIDENFRQAIHDVVDVYHGMEGLTPGQINESINNVFRSAKSQQKGKAEKQSLTQPPADDSTVSKQKKKITSNGKENIRPNNT